MHVSIGKDFIFVKGDALPDIPDTIDELFVDFEVAANFDESDGAWFPYNGDTAFSYAVTWDDHPHTYYIPFDHISPDAHENFDKAEAIAWLQSLFDRSTRWVNHNVKYDAHVAHCSGLEVPPKLILHCTEQMARLINSDRINHQLKSLCREWCSLEMEDEKIIKEYLKSIKSKNYARLPIRMCGAYAGWDVRGCRELYHYCLAQLEIAFEQDEEDERHRGKFRAVYENEVKLTRALFNAERRGIACDKTQVAIATVRNGTKLIELQERLQSEIGRHYSDSPKFNSWLFHEYLGIPPLAFKWKNVNGRMIQGNPTYDKDALEMYLLSEEVRTHPRAAYIIGLVKELRGMSHYQSLFLNAFMRLSDKDGVTHPSYRQNIRSGRMACGLPNIQQQNKESKKLIKPRKGRALLSSDASQVEFRIIVHLAKDGPAIAAYNENPDTDFHSWSSNAMGTPRAFGKMMNFAKSFGAGEAKIESQLAGNDEVIKQIQEEHGEIDEKQLHHFCRKKARQIIRIYKKTFPGIEVVAKLAKNTAKARGFIRTLFARRRQLRGYERIAFNSAVQGTASDIAKFCMVIFDNDEFLLEREVYLIAQVHDELLFEGPIEHINDPEVQAHIRKVLCVNRCGLRVPLRWSMGVSEVSWYEASRDDALLVTESLREAPAAEAS